MSVIHFLNVREGACNIIQHNSERISVIDVCCARKQAINEVISCENQKTFSESIKGNFNQKDYPENPINYIKKIVKSKTIFRYIQTHPDMDHMDGIKDLFESFKVINFWDTENTKHLEFNDKSPYRESDWLFYKSINKSERLPKTLFLYNSSVGKYYCDENDGDGLIILSPSVELIRKANSEGEFNQSSYVILYYTDSGKKIVFAGDSDKTTWDYILEKNANRKLLENIDVLIAPHHGRKTGGNDDYLNILKPSLTLFGNAKSQYLDYNSYRGDLLKITTNQANNIVLDISNTINIYVKYKTFAEKVYNEKTFSPMSQFHYRVDIDAYYIGTLRENNHVYLQNL